MKLSAFAALCDREWKKTDRGGRGDVVLITLAEASHVELANEVLTDGLSFIPWPLKITEEECAEIRAGAAITELANPITRTPVKIRTRKGAKHETARVRVPSGYRQTWWPASR